MPRTLARAYAVSSARSLVAGLARLPLGERGDLLVDRGVEEERQHGGRRTVDGQRHRRRRGDEVEAVEELRHVVEGRDRDARRADLAVDVGTRIGVAAVEGDGVEGGGEAGRVVAAAEDLEATVGPRRVALAGEHPRRVLVVALEREDARGEGVVAGQVLVAPERHQLAVVGEAGERDARDRVAAERLLGQPGVDLLVAHHDDLLVAGVGLHDRGPALDLVGDVVRHRLARGLEQLRHAARVAPLLNQCVGDVLHPLEVARRLGELDGLRVVAADRLGDLGEVAHAVGRDDLPDAGGVAYVDVGQRAVGDLQAGVGELGAQVLVERGHAVVVERGGAGAEHRHLVRLLAEGVAVADQLAPHVAQRVLGAAALELVDRHGVGEVEHVDLLQLRGGAELRRHDVERVVDERDDPGVALADAGCLDDHQVVAGGLQHVDHVGEVVRHLVGAAGRERAEEHPVAVEGVGADPVAQQRAATLAAGGVDGDDRDAQLVLLVGAEAAYDLVGQRRLARAAGAGDAEHGHDATLGGRPDLVEQRRVEASALGAGDGARDGEAVTGEDLLGRHRTLGPEVDVAVGDDGVDHPHQAHLLAVLGGEDRDARRAQTGDLRRDDDAATAADDLDVARTLGAQRLHEVLEVLHVPALVGRDRDALDVLLERGGHDLLHGAVVTEVDHLAALAHEDPPHDVDRRVVPVEERGRGDEADRVLRDVEVGHAQIVGLPSITRESRRGTAAVTPG